MIVFNNWQISVTGLIARQYDNLSRRIDVEGDLPAGYTWQLLVQSGGNADTILLEATEKGAGAVLTADNLSKAGEYYIQLRGVLEADGVTRRHTNVVSAYIPESLTGIGTWPEVPTEFAQIEQRCTTAMIAAESAADAAKADADRAAVLAAEVAQNASQVAQNVSYTNEAKEAAVLSASEAAQSAQEAAGSASVASTSETNAKASEVSAKAAQKAATESANAAANSAELASEDASAAAESASAAQQSATSAAESAAVYDTVVADVTQLKQEVATITPDDTTVDGKPWTSKKIVDSLCMPFEETGNPVQCYPVENYPLGVKASWEPVQEGSGDPSPDNIRPIKGRDSVTVEQCGKNLWKLGNVEFNQYKEISVFFPSGRYVFSGNVDTEASSETVQIGIEIDNVWKYTQKDKNKRFVINITAKNSITNFRLYAGNSPKYEEKATYSNIQLELGTTATPYEPYTGDTYDIALPETVYGGEVDAVSGEGRETWKFVTLDGTEAWINPSSNNYYAFFGNPAASKPSYGYCSHLPYTNKNKKCAYANENGAIVIYGYNADYTKEEFKAYLAAQYAAGTPVQICYKLAEPVPFTATGTQSIPALSGVNTIYTDADGVIVTGAEDPKHTITELKNAIISLGGNV